MGTYPGIQSGLYGQGPTQQAAQPGTSIASPSSPAGQAPAVSINWPPLPSWQIARLQELDSQNALYGVPPQVLAVIDWAESSGQGGGYNSAGYGGFFGLGTGMYPGGSVSVTQLRDPGTVSFAVQAQVAASEFRSLLGKTGGDPVKAEYYYQNGPNAGSNGTYEGANLMKQYLGGQKVGAAPIGQQLPGIQGAQSSDPCSNPTQFSFALTRKGTRCCQDIYLLNTGAGVHFLNECEARAAVGTLLIGVSGIVLLAGLAVTLTALGLKPSRVPSPVAFVAGEVQGRSAARRRATASRQEHEQRLEQTAARGAQTRRNQVRYEEEPF